VTRGQSTWRLETLGRVGRTTPRRSEGCTIRWLERFRSAGIEMMAVPTAGGPACSSPRLTELAAPTFFSVISLLFLCSSSFVSFAPFDFPLSFSVPPSVSFSPPLALPLLGRAGPMLSPGRGGAGGGWVGVRPGARVSPRWRHGVSSRRRAGIFPFCPSRGGPGRPAGAAHLRGPVPCPHAALLVISTDFADPALAVPRRGR